VVEGQEVCDGSIVILPKDERRERAGGEGGDLQDVRTDDMLAREEPMGDLVFIEDGVEFGAAGNEERRRGEDGEGGGRVC
jgi:hypothetical protein